MNDATKILLLMASTLAGTLLSFWRGAAGNRWISALALLGISCLLVVCGDHPLSRYSPPIAWVALLAGLAFGLSFPCCAPEDRIGPMAVVGTTVVVVHCLLDGHVVREVNTTALVLMFCLHKFMDGADGRLLSLNSKRATTIARVALALATPVGFLAIPPGVVPSSVHLSLFAGVIGFNFGTSFHIIRHELHAHGRPATYQASPDVEELL